MALGDNVILGWAGPGGGELNDYPDYGAYADCCQRGFGAGHLSARGPQQGAAAQELGNHRGKRGERGSANGRHRGHGRRAPPTSSSLHFYRGVGLSD